MESDLHPEKVHNSRHHINHHIRNVASCGMNVGIHVNLQVTDIWLCSDTLKGKGQNK